MNPRGAGEVADGRQVTHLQPPYQFTELRLGGITAPLVLVGCHLWRGTKWGWTEDSVP